MVLLNDCSDLKSTMSAGRSFHTFTTLMLKKDVRALQWLKDLYNMNDITRASKYGSK